MLDTDVIETSPPVLRRTSLYDVHTRLSAKMVAFAGYDMPVQYPDGIIAEHLHTRAQAGMFDVSHMGQLKLFGRAAESGLERIVSADLTSLRLGQTRYSLLLNPDGGIIDDVMITRYDDHLYMVINASRKDVDIPLIMEAVQSAGGAHEDAVQIMSDHALIALQGPQAGAVLQNFAPQSDRLMFMQSAVMQVAGVPAIVTRCGYTGEDGFELSVANKHALALAEALLGHAAVAPVGLGARDSLRLEAGLCLYGNDIDETTTPIEADLGFAIGKRRRLARDFLGADRILRQLEDGVDRLRVGLMIFGRRPARQGANILNGSGEIIGQVTSGGYSPTLERPIAMGYVAREYGQDGLKLGIDVRGKTIDAQVTPTPFVPQRYRRRNVQ